ncbi:GAF domain-containing protein [bacterium]|nr:GAF domain-containing protein [bacterium]
MSGQDARTKLREGHLETILATIPAGVIITDGEGRIVSANERASGIWGGGLARFSDVEAFSGFTGWWAESGERLDARDWAPIRALLQGEVVQGEVVDIERFDGSRATIVNSAAPLFDSQGQISGSVAVMQDVTEQLERQRTNEILIDALTALSESLDLSEVLERLVDVLLHTGRHTRATVMLWDAENEELEIAAVVGDPFTRQGTRFPLHTASSLMRAAVKEMRTVRGSIREIPVEERGLAATYGIVATLIVPLVRNGRLLGVATVDEMREDVQFSDREVAIIEGIAAQAGLAIENARLYEAEHHVATTLQQALLAMPDTVEGLSFAHAYRSASVEAFVGGDFYDVFEIEPGLVGMLVGDIAGKGLEAAVLTQLVKDTIRAHAAEKLHSSSAILELTNNIFYQVTGSDSFVTLFFGVLEQAAGRLHFTNAGHTTAVIVRASGHVVELPADSPLLGAFPDRAFAQSETSLGPDDLLVMYTDGITEARKGRMQYGEPRLLRLLPALRLREPGEVVSALVNDVLSFTGGQLNDDLAILVVKPLARESEVPGHQKLEIGAHA